MGYSVSWHIDQTVLLLKYENYLSRQELSEANYHIDNLLSRNQTRVGIIFEVSTMKTTYHTAEIMRETQTFVDHPNLSLALVVSENKLNRLTMLIAFAISSTRLVMIDSLGKAERILEQRGLQQPS